MYLIINRVKNINLYLLPLAAFFILISSAGTNAFILLTVIFSVIHCAKNKNYKIIFEKKIFTVCFILYIIFLISCFYSIADSEEIIEVIKKYIKFIYIPFIFYILKIYKNSELVIRFFISGSTIILILSYLKYFNIFNFDYFYDFLNNINLANTKDKIIINKTSIFQNYIIQGIVLSFYSFLCFYLAKRNNNIIYYILSALSFINVLFLNDSRAAYIIMIVLTLFSFYKIIKNNYVRIFFFLLFSLSIFTQFSSNLENRITALTSDMYYIENSNYNTSLGYRYIWAKVGLDNIVKRPIFGYGAGSFERSSIDYYHKNKIPDHKDYITNNPHNEFISISSQLGILGLSFFMAFIFFLFRDASNHILPFGIAITVFISSIFNSAFYDNMLGLFLIIIISLLYQNNYTIEK